MHRLLLSYLEFCLLIICSIIFLFSTDICLKNYNWNSNFAIFHFNRHHFLDLIHLISIIYFINNWFLFFQLLFILFLFNLIFFYFLNALRLLHIMLIFLIDNNIRFWKWGICITHTSPVIDYWFNFLVLLLRFYAFFSLYFILI